MNEDMDYNLIYSPEHLSDGVKMIDMKLESLKNNLNSYKIRVN